MKRTGNTHASRRAQADRLPLAVTLDPRSMDHLAALLAEMGHARPPARLLPRR